MSEKRPSSQVLNTTNTLDGKPAGEEKRPPFFTLLCVTALLSFGGLAAITAVIIFSAMIRDTHIYQDTDKGWQPLAHELPGTPNLLQTADDGALWVRTMFRGSLSRYADGRWKVFRSDQFRTSANYPNGGFALAGDQVWTTVDDILLRYDGDAWQHAGLLPMDPAWDHPLALAADAQGVWLLGSRGTLYRYENDDWQSEDLAVKFRDVPDEGRFGWAGASLTLADDGALWLAAGNVWRRMPGQQWQAAEVGPGGLHSATVVGQGPERMWFAQDHELLWVSLDLATHGRYTGEEMSLPADVRINAVADNGETVLVSTSEGLTALEAGRWAQRPLENSELELGAVSFTPRGDAWLVAYRPFDTAPIWIVSSILTGVSLLLLVVVWQFCRLPSRRPTLRIGVSVVAVLMLICIEIVAVNFDFDGADGRLLSTAIPMMVCALALPLPLLLVMLRWFQFRGSRGLERISFRPVAEHDLPKKTLQYFSQHTDEIEALGFRHLADYSLKRRTPFFTRVFLSEDGQTFAEISTQRAMVFIEIKACSFVSMFASGDYLETGNLTGKDRDAGAFHHLYAGRRPLAEVLEAHRNEAQSVSQQHDTFTVPLEPDDFPVVSTHGLKLLYDALVREGVVTMNPYLDAAAPQVAEMAGV